MSVPTRRAISQAAISTGTDTLTLNKPAGTVQGDVMYAFLANHRGTHTIDSAPAGWTLLPGFPQAGSVDTEATVYVYRKIAGASEPASYSWVYSTANARAIGYLVATVGADPLLHTHIVDSGFVTSPVTLGPMTTTAPDCLILAFVAQKQVGALDNYTWPAGWTPEIEIAADGGTCQAALGSLDQAAAGTVNPTLTADDTSNDSTWAMVAVRGVAAPLTGYPAEVMADSPSHWWRLGEASGNAVDSVGGKNGTPSGTMTRDVAGLINATDDDGAVDLGGDNSYFDLPTSLVDLDTTWTLEGWIRPDNIDRGAILYLAKDMGGGVVDSLSLGYDENGFPSVQCDDSGGSSRDVTYATALTVGQTYHLAATHDGTTMRLYLNGAQVGSLAFTPKSWAAPYDWQARIGAFGATASPWSHDGKIDEVAIYDTALSAARILAHYTAGIGVTAVGKSLQAIYHVRGKVGRSLQVIHNVRLTVAKSVQILHNVRQKVGRSVQALFHVRSAVTRSVQTIYNVRQTVSRQVATLWNVVGAGLTVVGRSWEFIWNERGLAGRSVQVLHHVRAAVGRSLQVVYTVRVAVARTLEIPFHVTIMVGRAWQTIHHVRSVVGNARQVVYHVRSIAGSTKSFLWHVAFTTRWSIAINEVERRPWIFVKTFSLGDDAGEGIGTLTFRVRTDGFWEPANEQVVRASDRGIEIFEGFIRRVTRLDYIPGAFVYDVECQSYTSLLEDDVVPKTWRGVTESIGERIEWLVQTFGTRGVTAGVEILTLTDPVPAGEDGRPEQEFGPESLASAISQVTKLIGVNVYVDSNKVIRPTSDEIAAPFHLSATPDGVTTKRFGRFSYTTDTIADGIHEVLVSGAEGIEVWRQVAGAPPVGERRRAVINDADITSQTQAQQVGDAYLSLHGVAAEKGRCVVFEPGLQAGMTVQITHPKWGLVDAPFRINRVVPTLNSSEVIEYEIEFGAAFRTATGGGGGGGSSVGSPSLAEVFDRATAVERQLAGLSIGASNIIPNSSIESADTTGWTVGAGWLFHLELDEGDIQVDGANVVELSRAGTIAGQLITPWMVVDPTTDYWFSVYSQMWSYTSGTGRLLIEERDENFVLLQTTTLAEITALETEWTRHAMHFGPNDQLGRRAFHPNTRMVRIIADSAGVAATLSWYLDAFQGERSNFLSAYAPAVTELLQGSITSTHIAANAVTTPKVAANAIVTGKIASGVSTTGMLIVSSAGGTVIIDGTSNVFKIIASGTLSTPQGTSPGSAASLPYIRDNTVDISTNLAYAPAFNAFLNAAADVFITGTTISWGLTAGTPEVHPFQQFLTRVRWVSGNKTRVSVELSTWALNTFVPGQTFRYYVFKEVAF